MNPRFLLPATLTLALLAAPAARAEDPSPPSQEAAAPPEAMASPEAVAKVVQLNREGIAQYQKKHFDAARKLMKQALDLCESSGLGQHPVAARTHIHLGIIIVAGFGQRDIGRKQFSEALAIQPDIVLTPGLATPALQDTFNEAVIAAPPRAPAAPLAEGQAAPQAASDDGSSFVPAETPEPAAPPTSAEVIRAERQAARGTKDIDEDDEDEVNGAPASRIQLGLMLGGGTGWASGHGDLNADTPVPGSFAGAMLDHVAAEAGYWLTPTWMVSLQGRFQRVAGTTIVQANGRTYHPANGAVAAFAAATWSPPIKGQLHPFVSAGVGAGRIRHVVTLDGLKDCGPTRNEVCVDSVGGGPFLMGAGGGLTIDLGQRVGLVFALSTQLGAPRFTFNVDVNGGVAFHL